MHIREVKSSLLKYINEKNSSSSVFPIVGILYSNIKKKKEFKLLFLIIRCFYRRILREFLISESKKIYINIEPIYI